MKNQMIKLKANFTKILYFQEISSAVLKRFSVTMTRVILIVYFCKQNTDARTSINQELSLRLTYRHIHIITCILNNM